MICDLVPLMSANRCSLTHLYNEVQGENRKNNNNVLCTRALIASALYGAFDVGEVIQVESKLNVHVYITSKVSDKGILVSHCLFPTF